MTKSSILHSNSSRIRIRCIDIYRSLLLWLGILFLGLGFEGNSSAALVVAEDFNYTTGASLVGQTGGTGFSGPWARRYSGNTDGTIVPGLTFSDFPVSGKAVKLAATSPGTNSASNIRPFTAGTFGVGPQTVWASYLYTYTVTPGTSPAFYSGMSTTNSSYPDETRFGLSGTNGSKFFQGSYQSPGGAVSTTQSQPANTYLLIGKYVGGTNVTVWVLSVYNYNAIKAGGITEAELNATNSGKMVDNFATGDSNVLQAYLAVSSTTLGGNSALTVTIGNIRMGTTLDDVAPVPPPASGNLLVSENFNYTIGSSLIGQNGGTGFSGGWARRYSSNADGTIVAGLTFSDYPMSGNAARLSAVYPGNNACANMRPFTTGLFGTGPQTVWASYLFSYSVTPGTGPSYYSGLITQNSNYPDNGRFGLSNTSNFVANYESPGGTYSPGASAQNTTYLMVGKYVGGTGMTLWVLSTANYDAIKAGGITEAELNATNTAKMSDNFTTGDANVLQAYLSIYSSTFGNGSSQSVTIGSIKMGSTIDAVVNNSGGSSSAPEQIGGGTIANPAVGPAPSYGIGGAGFTIVKNWNFGTNGTIKNNADLEANFQFHDQFEQIANKNYGAVMVAPSAASASTHVTQPLEGTNTGGAPVRSYLADYMRTYLVPLNGATTVVPASLNCGSGSFQAKWTLPNGGSLLGKDIIWETRVRYVTPPYFWFSIWNSGNIWNPGAEMDLVESYGESSGSYTNYVGKYWHSNTVAGTDQVNYTGSGWGNGMSSVGITNFDATQYHVWTLAYFKDNTYAIYVDSVQVQFGSGPYYWTAGATSSGTPINMSFIFDGTWGSRTITNNNHSLPATSLNGTYYEWDYSRVYLR